MGDVRALHSTLTATDITAPRIQASASSMMRLYENPALAVSEWRNVLQSCQHSQLLPLLYVANEVLQTSKRNRGNKFLEAFGPVLGGSLRFICERDPRNTEKVRRTAKIWGDRRVFSLRFVGEILAGLESFRNVDTGAAAGTGAGGYSQAQKARQTSNTIMNRSSNSQSSAANAKEKDSDSDEDMFGDNDDADEGASDHRDSFGDTGPSLLNVSNFSIHKAAMQSNSQQKQAFGAKRRRSSTSSPTNRSAKKGKTSPKRHKSMKLSASSFKERIQQLENLDSEYRSVVNIISSITSSDLCNGSLNDEIQEVGDELTDLHTDINRKIETVRNHRALLYSIAEQKKEVEMELKRYLTWMMGGLNTDDEEMKLCLGLEEKLKLLQLVHADAKKIRDDSRAKEKKDKEMKEAAERKKAKEEALQKSLEQIQRKDGPKEGMVWNKQAREYQYLADATEESWRD